MRRLVLAALAGGAYAAYRLGRAYDPEDPVAGLAAFGATVQAGMLQREHDLRHALGMDVAVEPRRGKGDGRAPGGSPRHTPSATPLTADQARRLLLDPAGPDPRRLDEGAGI